MLTSGKYDMLVLNIVFGLGITSIVAILIYVSLKHFGWL